MDNSYKLEQLRAMLAIEQGEKGAESAGYGAHLTHWAGHGIAPIQLNADAIKALIREYEGQDKKEGEK